MSKNSASRTPGASSPSQMSTATCPISGACWQSYRSGRRTRSSSAGTSSKRAATALRRCAISCAFRSCGGSTPSWATATSGRTPSTGPRRTRTSTASAICSRTARAGARACWPRCARRPVSSWAGARTWRSSAASSTPPSSRSFAFSRACPMSLTRSTTSLSTAACPRAGARTGTAGSA